MSFLAEATTVGLEDALHLLAVTLPQGLLSDMLLEVLQRVEEPQRCIGSHAGRAVTCEVAIGHIAYQRVDGIHAVLLVVLRECDAGQCHEGIARERAEPGVSCDHLGAVIGATYHKLTCRVLEAA